MEPSLPVVSSDTTGYLKKSNKTELKLKKNNNNKKLNKINEDFFEIFSKIITFFKK